MAQFQILQYEVICGIIVEMPKKKSVIDKIVSRPEESVIFFYLNAGNKTKWLRNAVSVFFILSACILN